MIVSWCWQAKKLRDEYLAKFRGAVAASVATLQSAKDHCKEVKEKVCVSVDLFVHK